MAGRDVEFNVTSSDKTGPGLASAERRFKATQDKMRKDSERFQKVFGDGIGKGLSDGLASASRIAGPALAGLAVSAAGAIAPVLAGTLSAAVVGGATAGGILGGIAIVSRDARVQAAGTTLAANLMSGLETRASVFVQPVLRSIDMVDARFKQSGNTIEAIFRNSAKFVEPLTDAALDAGQSLLEGIETATERAEPVMKSFENGIRDTGNTLKGVIENLSEDGDATARNLDSAFATLNGTLKVTGEVVSGINKTFDFLGKIMPLSAFDTYQKGLDQIEGTTRRTGSGTFELADGLDGAGDAAQDAAAKAKEYADKLREAEEAVRGMFDANRELYGSTTETAQAIADATKIIGENGEGLKLNTEKGRENRDALSDVASQLGSNYEAYLAVNGAGAGATAVAKANRDAFVKLAEKAGYGADAAQDLANRLLGIPNVNPTVTVRGVEGAKAAARTISATLRAIKDENVNINYQVNGTNSSALRAAAAKNNAAEPGPSFSDGSVSRTGGASPVSVSSTIQNVITLDGAPFRAMTARTVSENNRRERHRARYGGRY
jgi:hypothetical protein